MSHEPTDDDERVFKSRARRDLFWQKFNALVEEFPEMINGIDAILNGDIDEEGLLYNPQSPKFVQGAVVVLSIRNLDHWESMFVIDPPEQSQYMTGGLLSAAHYLQSAD